MVLAISGLVGGDLAQRFAIPPSKVEVLYNWRRFYDGIQERIKSAPG